MGEIKIRNYEIAAMMSEYRQCHEKNFPQKGPLTDEQWQNSIHEMDAIADKYRHKDYAALSFKLNQAFLDDIETANKIWKEYLRKKNEAKV